MAPALAVLPYATITVVACFSQACVFDCWGKRGGGKQRRNLNGKKRKRDDEVKRITAIDNKEVGMRS
jgi:hypothetical protein